MKKQTKRIKFIDLVFLGVVFLFVLIVVRLQYVSNSRIVDGKDMKAFAENRNITKNTLYASRGSIYDVEGEPLAHNVNSYIIVANLDKTKTTNENNPKHVVDKEHTAKELANLINMSEEKILERLNKDEDGRTKQVEIHPSGGQIGELVKQNIEQLALPGISFIRGTKREYPNGQFASYILGYVRDKDGELVGEMGIESYYNDELKGINGYKEYQRDLKGFQIPDTYVKEEPALNGNNIYLTIDSNVQVFLENALDKLVDKYTPQWAILTVMDAKTGAIVGSATNPTFNPKILNITDYKNPLISYTFEPGSTMKVFSFMAAMEKGIYKGDELYKSGSIAVADAVIRDHIRDGWGMISYDTGFTYSSNVAATMLSKKMGKNDLKSYYEKLGFGKKTGIELSNELQGINNIKYEVEVANAAFGQGMTVTPIQMLQAMTAVTNNGMMLKPYIIDKIVNPNTNEITYKHKKEELGVVASVETVNKIKDLMDETVNGADSSITGKAFASESVTVIGKTGTAQIVGSSGKYLNGKYDYVRSFIGAFPKEEPEYIVYIATNKLIGTNKNLGETVTEIVENISKNKYLNSADSTEDEYQYVLPQFINTKTQITTEKINSLTNNYIILGDGEYIVDQYPKQGTKLHNSNKVYLLTSANTYIMPKVIGWSMSEMNNFCKLLDLDCTYNEYGYVTSTTTQEGKLIDKNITLNVDLKPK